MAYLCFVERAKSHTAGTLLAAVNWAFVEVEGHLPEAGRAAVAFGRLRPGGEGGPMHRLAVGAMIARLWESGEQAAAEIVAVDFDCCLRGGEWQRIHPEDIDLAADGAVAIRLGILARGEQTKTGPNQGVVVATEHVRALLRRRKAARPKGTALWPLKPQAFYSAWRAACESLGLADTPPHSLRHGAAAEAIQRGGFTEGAVRATQLRGRWQSTKSLKRYAKPHLLVSALAALPDATRALGERFWASPDAWLD